MTSSVLQLQGVDKAPGSHLTQCSKGRGQDVFGLVIQNPMCQSVSNIVGNANPLSRMLAAAWPTVFMIQIKNLLKEHKLEQNGNVWDNAFPKLVRCHVNDRIPGAIPNINEINGSHEPQDIGCANAIQQGVNSRFQPPNGSPSTGFCCWLWGSENWSFTSNSR